MKQNAIAAGLSLVVGLPLGWIAAMLLTPALWRLEPIFHIELAGHSGPSDWVFYVVWAVVLPTLFFFLRFVVLRKHNDPDRIDPVRGSENPS
jgi:ABC-type antimicrobial peptide transport system permease subunit